ncbi:MAG: hypothetical protein IE934_15970 [Sphingopyxis sp.]|nr:hypothetical protein [Sphingopyxis sp.]
MTFMIILGAVAAVYIAILMFRLAAVALPLYAGIGTTLYLIDRDLGYLVPIIAGLVVGALIVGCGRALCAVLPPLYRFAVMLVFAIPAGFAGYQAARGFAGLGLADGAMLEALGFAGALVAAAAAMRGLGARQDSAPNEAAIGAV